MNVEQLTFCLKIRSICSTCFLMCNTDTNDWYSINGQW